MLILKVHLIVLLLTQFVDTVHIVFRIITPIMILASLNYFIINFVILQFFWLVTDFILKI